MGNKVLILISARGCVHQSSVGQLGALRRPHFHATLAINNQQSIPDYRQGKHADARGGKKTFPQNAIFVQRSKYDRQKNLFRLRVDGLRMQRSGKGFRVYPAA